MNPRALPQPSRALLPALMALFLVACSGQSFHAPELGTATFLERAISQQVGPIAVSTAVPSAEETRELIGLDLYKQGIQPIWLKVENHGEVGARVTHWSIDRNYFSPLEVAYMNRSGFSSQRQAELEQWFYDNRLPRTIPPEESRSGLIYSHVMPGTKGFNLDVLTRSDNYHFTFFVPLPGFTADYLQVKFSELYPDAQIIDLDEGSFQTELENTIPCCSSNSSGDQLGAPLNVALVATPLTMRRALLRGGWHETAAASIATEAARLQHYRLRPPDATFQKTRADGNEEMELRLWLAPYRVDGVPVWMAQAIYQNTQQKLWQRLTRESVSADTDSAQRFVLQNFWYAQSLDKTGYVDGVGAATMESPLLGFTGAEYITRGQRVVIYLSEQPVALDGAKIIYRRALFTPLVASDEK